MEMARYIITDQASRTYIRIWHYIYLLHTTINYNTRLQARHQKENDALHYQSTSMKQLILIFQLALIWYQDNFFHNNIRRTTRFLDIFSDNLHAIIGSVILELNFVIGKLVTKDVLCVVWYENTYKWLNETYLMGYIWPTLGPSCDCNLYLQCS